MTPEDLTAEPTKKHAGSNASHEFAAKDPNNFAGDGDITLQEALKSKSVIDSNLPDVGGWKITNKILGKTPGERKFNLLDWYGIGFGLNSVISIWAGDQARQGMFWPAFKKVNHALGNSFIFREKPASHPHKFSALEAEHLDYFVDELRSRAIKDSRSKILSHPKIKSDVSDELLHKAELSEDDKKFLYRKIRRTNLPDLLNAFEQNDPEGMHAVVTNLQHKYGTGKFAHIKGEQWAHGNTSTIFKELAENAKTLKTSRTNARVMTSFFMLSVGGWALMFPIKWLEDRKAGLVRYFDDRYEKKHHLSEAQKETLHARHNELDAEPKQTYASVLMARLISYPLILTSYMTLGPEIKTLEENGHKSSSWLAKYVFPKYKGTDHYMGKGAKKIDGALKRHEIPGYARFKRWMYDAADEREELYFGSKKTFANKELLSRFSARDPDSRAQGIIVDTLTEGAYSIWMTTCTFITSRFTASFFGKKKDQKKPDPVNYDSVNTPVSGLSPANANAAPAANTNVALPETPQTPTTRVTGTDALSTWMTQQKPAAERLAAAPAAEPVRA